MKKLVSFTLAGCILFSNNILANEINNELINNINNEKNEIQLTHPFDLSLSTMDYRTLATDNNIFAQKLKVSNHTNNPGTMIVRVIKSDGTILINPVAIRKGTIATLPTIPANAGSWTLQGQAQEISGRYTGQVTD